MKRILLSLLFAIPLIAMDAKEETSAEQVQPGQPNPAKKSCKCCHHGDSKATRLLKFIGLNKATKK